MTTKKRASCKGCGSPKGPGRGYKWCESCRDQRKEDRRHRRAGIRGLSLEPRYRLTVEDYDRLAESQGGVCAICRRVPPTSRLLKFSVDHDHATGEIRGLLCQRCNMALHYIENVEFRSAAEFYLACPPARVLRIIDEHPGVKGSIDTAHEEAPF